MIPVQRVAAPEGTLRLLHQRALRVEDAGGTAASARDEWRRARTPRQHVQALLQQMAHGIQRCMYCEDSLGTDVDHFQPIATAPLRTFDWHNHLLACSHCNSNQKRDAYPCDADGAGLLVDPTAENPAEHLSLLLASGEYIALTAKGEATIRVFGLNRGDLVRGRQAAFAMACVALRGWYADRQAGEDEDAERTARALRASPFAAVVHTMEALPTGVAATVLGARTATALDAWCARPGGQGMCPAV